MAALTVMNPAPPHGKPHTIHPGGLLSGPLTRKVFNEAACLVALLPLA